MEKSKIEVAAQNEQVVVSPIAKPQVEKELFAWTAPARPFKRRDREFYVTLLAIAGIVGLVLFLVEGFMPVILMISLLFLFYVLSTVEPENLQYKITNAGVRVGGGLVTWSQLGRYWFAKRLDSDLLILETSILPGRMELVVNAKDKESLKKVLNGYLVEEAVPPSFLDKASVWVINKFSKKKV